MLLLLVVLSCAQALRFAAMPPLVLPPVPGESGATRRIYELAYEEDQKRLWLAGIGYPGLHSYSVATMSWQLNVVNATVGYFDALLLRGSTLYVGGTFSRLGGAARTAKLAALDVNTLTVSSLNSSLVEGDTGVYDIAPHPDGQAIVYSGLFNTRAVYLFRPGTGGHTSLGAASAPRNVFSLQY